jgi:hypothetical protein
MYKLPGGAAHREGALWTPRSLPRTPRPHPPEIQISPTPRTPPHACSDGLVFLTYTVFDEEIGEECEKIEAVPCRRCAEEAR